MSSGTPIGWKSVELREVGKIVTGSTPPKARQEYYGGNFPFVKPGELLHCPISESTDRLSDVGSEVADVVPAGSVLVSCIGNLGKTGLATRSVAFNQQINAIVPHIPEHSKWVFYAVQTSDFASQIAAVSSATTIAIVNKGKFSTLKIPLAPLPEQKRIVAEIEKQFTRLDAGIAALKRTQANLKRYRAAVLKSACEGKLVPTEAELAKTKGRKYETGAQLLQRILTERRKNWSGRGKYKEPAAPDTANLPALPEGWVYATVEQLGVVGEQPVLTGPFGTNLGREDFTESGVPLLTISCLQDTGIKLEKAEFISTEKARELKKYMLRPGDLLFSRMASVGRAGIVGESLRGALFNYHIMRLRLESTALLAKFYMAYVRGSVQVESYLREVNHGATRAGINTEQLINMPVALPPFAEQARIVEEVERRLSMVEELESLVETNLQRATKLRQSILQKAFSGEL